VEVWNCGKISLILFLRKKEQADIKKDQAEGESEEKRIRLSISLGGGGERLKVGEKGIKVGGKR
jgi:hypothetical protein